MTNKPISRIAGWSAANRILLALLVLAAAKSLLWSVAIPPWRAPDEPQHFGYIEYLSKEKGIPLYGRTPLYPDIIDSQQATDFGAVLGQESNYDSRSPAQNPAALHPPLYYLAMLPAYAAAQEQAIETQLYVVRIFGGVIFLALIAVSYRFAGLVFPRARYMQIGVPLLLIFHPQLSFISAGVMNDALLALLFTVFLHQAVIVARGDLSLRRAAIMGAVIGLGMLTKSSFLIAYMIGAPLMAVLLVTRKDQRLAVIRAAAVAVGLSLIICAWFYLRNYLALGEVQPGNRMDRYVTTGWWHLLTATRFRADLFASFIANYSWLTLPLSEDTLYWVRRILQLSVAGLAAALVIGRMRGGWLVMKNWLVLLFAAVLAVFAVMVVYFELSFGGAQGRYLFPAGFAIWSLVLAGMVGWLPPAWRPRATAVVVSAAACFWVWALLQEFSGRVT